MGSDFSIFFSEEGIITFILVLTRLSAMLLTAPLFSTFPIPNQLKIALAGTSAFIMYPFVLQHSQFTIPTDLIALSFLLVKEVFIGTLIGFCASLIFTAVQIGGQILSIQMGLAIATALDPVTKQNVAIVGQFYLFTASLVFIFLNGHQWLFSTIYDSYVSMPIGLNFDFSSKMTLQIIHFSSQIFSIAFSLIIPIFEILLATTILMGFMAKIMPQMNIFMVAMPIKIYIGLGLLAIAIPQTTVYLFKLIKDLLLSLNSIFIF